MRLFVGVAIDDNVRGAAATAARELQRRLDGRVRATWIAAEKMHLTVRFIGHVEDSRVPDLLQALAPPLAIAPFDIHLGKCGAFPRTGLPRVLWIDLRDGLPSLQAMHDELNRRLRPLGFAPEERPFNAHLTLARVKDVPRESIRATRDALAAVLVPAVRGRIDHATVFESRPSPRGSSYAQLLEIPLT
jgi:2'-5' RNA ligase